MQASTIIQLAERNPQKQDRKKKTYAYIAKIRTINTKVSNVREKENLRGDHQPGADRPGKRKWSRVREGRKDAIRGTGEGIGEGLGFRMMEERESVEEEEAEEQRAAAWRWNGRRLGVGGEKERGGCGPNPSGPDSPFETKPRQKES